MFKFNYSKYNPLLSEFYSILDPGGAPSIHDGEGGVPTQFHIANPGEKKHEPKILDPPKKLV